MRAAKKDSNHEEIEQLFRQFKWKTIDTSSCHGKLLDFIAYKPNGKVWFVEVKNGDKELTKEELKFFKANPERSIVIKSYEDGFNFLTKVEYKL